METILRTRLVMSPGEKSGRFRRIKDRKFIIATDKLIYQYVSGSMSMMNGAFGEYSVMIFSLFAYNGQKERHSPMHCGNWPRVSISVPICLSAFYVIVNTKSHCLPPVHGTLSLCIRMGLLNRTFSSVKNGGERAKPCLLRITKNRGEIRTLPI